MICRLLGFRTRAQEKEVINIRGTPYMHNYFTSLTGLGAVLYQHQIDQDHVVSCADRNLKPSEKIYPTLKLDLSVSEIFMTTYIKPVLKWQDNCQLTQFVEAI